MNTITSVIATADVNKQRFTAYIISVVIRAFVLLHPPLFSCNNMHNETAINTSESTAKMAKGVAAASLTVEDV